MIGRRFFSVVKSLISQKLSEFNPAHLEIVNDSWMHQLGEETHFKILIVSDKFNGVSSFKREYDVSRSLKDVWDKGVVLINLTVKTKEEYDEYKKNEFFFEYPTQKS